MSIPYTSTHSVSLRDNQIMMDVTQKHRVAGLRHPVQYVIDKNGSENPHLWRYDNGFWDLDDLLAHSQSKHGSGVDFAWDRWDDVEWTDVPQGWRPHSSNYAKETRHKLQQGSRAKERAENMRMSHQRENLLRAAQSRLHPQLYSEISHHHGSVEDNLADELSNMRLGKRQNYYGVGDGRGSNKGMKIK